MPNRPATGRRRATWLGTAEAKSKGSANQKRSHRPLDLKEAAPQSAAALWRAAVRHLLAAAFVCDTHCAPRGCLDALQGHGWSSLSVAMRYIHPSEDRVLAAFANVGTGDKTGDSRESNIREDTARLELSASEVGG